MLRLGTQGLAGSACLTGSLYIGATGSHVPYGSQDHGHATFMPDAGWAIIGHLPTLSQERDPLLVSTSPRNLSTRHQGVAHTRLRDPHLTGITCLFPQRSRQRLFAAWGGLKPAPESRLRRAYPSSSIQLRKPDGLAFVTHDPLIYYFAMLGKHFGMRQARIWLTFAPVKPPDLTGGVCASPCNLIVRDGLTY